MEMITIENRHFIATIESKGAQLIHLVNKKSNRELIWQRDKNFWGRSAPILFPVIGGLKNDCYHLYGKNYQMGKHGFCRDALFLPTLIKKNKVVFSYRSNETTYDQYPFQFSIDVIFELQRKGMKQSFRIKNLDDKKMWFCLGGHPAFNLPMEEGYEFEHYQVRFEKKEKNDLWYLENDLLAGKKENWLNETQQFHLKAALFDNDALIFKGLKSKKIYLELQAPFQSNKRKKAFVLFNLGSFPMVGIWTKEGGAPYLCLEPWYGVDDEKESDGDFTQKIAVQSLAPRKTFKAWFAFGGE